MQERRQRADAEHVALGVEIAVLVVLVVAIGLLARAAIFSRAKVRRLEGELEDANRRADSAALTDGLTALGNRLAFADAVEREVSRSRRSGSSLSVVVFDVDDFGSVNDGYGLPRGDQLLKAVAGVIASQVRKPDLCFRWGEDEFVVLLPETSRDGAVELARRIRGVTAAEMQRPDGGPLRLTAGIAHLSDHADGGALLAAADRDLLRAKRATGTPAPRPSPG